MPGSYYLFSQIGVGVSKTEGRSLSVAVPYNHKQAKQLQSPNRNTDDAFQPFTKNS